MPATPAFRLLGFPVHVRPGFFMLMVLVVFLNGTDLGLWLAGFMALFTLLHELGHAIAARATGARAEIALDFLYGYASFVPTRRLKRWERAGISLAGPGAQIVISVAVLLALGVNPLYPGRGAEYSHWALWWAGPVIGVLNLIPVLPFDGGNIAEAALDAVLPANKAHLAMMYASPVLTVAGIAYLFSQDRLRNFVIFGFIPLIAQLQMLSHHREVKRRAAGRGSANLFAMAEQHAWETGEVNRFVAGQIPSPWFRAYQQLSLGHPEVARDLLLADLTDDDEPNWWPPDAAPDHVLSELVRLLPQPLPPGRTYSEFVLAGVLLRLGDYAHAARYAAEGYRRQPSPMLAVCVSRAAAALGDRATALGWLRAAVGEGPASDGLRHAAASAPEFDELRHDNEFLAITHASV